MQRGRPLRVPEVVQYGVKVFSALEALHEAGWMHLDVKPGNILVEDGNPLLTDFGLVQRARPLSPEDEARTRQEKRAWTEGYAPQEQIEGYPTIWSDLYSGAATLWALSAGEPPFFQGRSVVPSIRDVPGVTVTKEAVALDRILHAAMSPEPADRAATFQTITGFRDSLQSLDTSALPNSASTTIDLSPDSATKKRLQTQVGELERRKHALGAEIADARAEEFAARRARQEAADVTAQITVATATEQAAGIVADADNEAARRIAAADARIADATTVLTGQQMEIGQGKERLARQRAFEEDEAYRLKDASETEEIAGQTDAAYRERDLQERKANAKRDGDVAEEIRQGREAESIAEDAALHVAMERRQERLAEEQELDIYATELEGEINAEVIADSRQRVQSEVAEGQALIARVRSDEAAARENYLEFTEATTIATAAAKEKLADVTGQTNEAEAHLDRMRHLEGRVQDRIGRGLDELDGVETRIAGAEERVQKLGEREGVLRGEVASLEGQAADARTRVGDLKGQEAALQERVHELQDQVAHPERLPMPEGPDAMRDEQASLRQRLADLNAKIYAAESDGATDPLLEAERAHPMIERAKEILGEDFHGVEAIRKLEAALRESGKNVEFIFDRLPEFPYTEGDLQAAKAAGEMLVLRPERMLIGLLETPITVAELKEVFDSNNRQELPRIDIGYMNPEGMEAEVQEYNYRIEKRINTEGMVATSYALVGKDIIPGSFRRQATYYLDGYSKGLSRKGAKHC
jgi:archaellum component FlaC